MSEPATPARRGPGLADALREAAVIALGALAALAGQAWWQDRQDRGREREYLTQLLADTRVNERRLGNAIEADSATGRALAAVTRAFTTPGPLPPADSVRRWLFDGTSSSDFRPLTGTYAALVGTGDLHLVRTDSLRAMLGSYASSIEYERQLLQLILQMGLEAIDVLPRKLPFARALLLPEAERPPEAPFDFARVRDDPDMATMLFRLHAANQNRLQHLRRLRGETRRLRAALEAEGRGGGA